MFVRGHMGSTRKFWKFQIGTLNIGTISWYLYFFDLCIFHVIFECIEFSIIQSHDVVAFISSHWGISTRSSPYGKMVRDEIVVRISSISPWLGCDFRSPISSNRLEKWTDLWRHQKWTAQWQWRKLDGPNYVFPDRLLSPKVSLAPDANELTIWLKTVHFTAIVHFVSDLKW